LSNIAFNLQKSVTQIRDVSWVSISKAHVLEVKGDRNAKEEKQKKKKKRRGKDREGDACFAIFIMRSYTRYTQTQANNNDDNNNKRKKEKKKKNTDNCATNHTNH